MNQAEIRDYRRRKGISQGKLAELVGCSQPTISLIERQQIAAAPLLMRNISEILDPAANRTAHQPLKSAPLGHFAGHDHVIRLQFPAPTLPRFLTIEQWKRPELGGDLVVFYTFPKGRGWTVTVVAVDLAGSGSRMMQASAYLSGWLRGVLASKQQPIAIVLEELSDECRRMGLEASAVGLEISGFDQRKGIDIEVVSAAFPPILVVNDPPFRTDSIGTIGPALPLRESEYLSTSRLRLESGTLVISTDGLLERLGGTDQSAGRREIVKHLTSTKRHQPTSDWLSTRVPSRDDELAVVIAYRPWDINELIWVDDDRERLRVQRSLEQWLTESRLSDSPDGQLPRAQFAAIAVAELLDNVRQHAHGSNNAIVRAMRTSEFVRIEVIDDGIGPPPARIINERAGGVFEMIRQVSDHRYIEEASPRGCLVGMVFKTLQRQGNQDSTT